MEADFSGYATKHGLKCADGRTILSDAFKDNDGGKVPLVWQHRHDEATNVLGHALLENRPDGVYAYGFFNDSPTAEHARTMVEHGDISSLSIYANNLVENRKQVSHGVIRELSLVLSGANPGALIENVNIRHGDSNKVLDDEAVIFSGSTLQHADNSDSNEGANVAESTDTSNPDDKTIQDVVDSMTEEQKNVMYFLVGTAADQEGGDEELAQSGLDLDDLSNSISHSIQEGFDSMSRNVFDKTDDTPAGNTLSHAQVQAIMNDAEKAGSLKEAFLAHAAEYGFDKIDLMFPDARALANSPEMIARRTEWVSKVISGTKHSPFSRIKSLVADITADEARARGYVKGNLKKEEIIKLLTRKTGPTTIYKKQKLDRDDIIDITDFDVVSWLKAEMRLMLDEELARAILLGDGREYGDDDKIDEDAIRPIVSDADMYAHKVDVASGESVEDTLENMIRARSNYRGSGMPTLFTTQSFLTEMLLLKDKVGRRVYDTQAALASAIMVSDIVTVEVMEQYENVVAIFVNLNDYTIGADKGGQVSMFDDFDIDYNQNKYLIETRVSGALTKPKSAVVVRRVEGETVKLTAPSFDGAKNIISFPQTTGVSYYIDGVKVTAQTKTITKNTDVEARADSGYHLEPNVTAHWNFVYNA